MFKIVKNVVKYVKVAVEYYGDMKNDNNNLIFNKDEINAEGYILRKNGSKLLKSRIAIAGMAIVEFDNEHLVPCIYIDRLYEMMSKNAQDFIIQHELGHFEYHKDKLLDNYERYDEMENEADEYAAQIIGYDNVISALEEIKEMLLVSSLYCNKAGVKEIERRIKYIEKIK